MSDDVQHTEGRISQSDADLVSCDGCGLVFEYENVPDTCCPVCGQTTRKTTAMPRIGHVHVWWSKL